MFCFPSNKIREEVYFSLLTLSISIATNSCWLISTVLPRGNKLFVFKADFQCWINRFRFKNGKDVERAFLVDPLYLKHEHSGNVQDFRVIC